MDIGLAPFAREDLRRLIAWMPDGALLMQWAGASLFRFPLDEAQLEDYLRATQGEAPARQTYKAVDDPPKRPWGARETPI